MKTFNFKQYFENNEINGWLSGSTIQKPVYHGTNVRFDQFKYQKSKRYVLFSEFDVESHGFFFSESPHDALAFGRNVATCYVRLLKPLLDPRKDRHLGVDRLDYVKEMHVLKILGAMVQREKGEPFIDIGVRRQYLKNRHYEFAHQWIYECVESDGLNWDCLDNPEVIRRMLTLGYDGTFVAEPDSYVGRSVFVPSADQVKIDTWTVDKQDHWGAADDYSTKKVDGFSNFYGPNNV